MRVNWIKLTDRQPPDLTQVLVYLPEQKLSSRGIIEVGRKMKDSDTWVISGVFSFDIGTPSHWAELPEPPKTET